MRRLGFALISLVLLVGMTGCMISTQEGERTHVNSAAPDEIAFHFDTSFNRALLYGRSMVLLGIAVWFLRSRGSSSGRVPVVLAVVFASAAAGWYFTGQRKLANYRIELAPTGMELQLPSQPMVHIDWADIESIDGDGVARDVSFGDGKGQALKWSVEWEELIIHLHGGEKVKLNLKPLSMEQRGTLWRAVARFADLEVQTWSEQTRR